MKLFDGRGLNRKVAVGFGYHTDVHLLFGARRGGRGPRRVKGWRRASRVCGRLTLPGSTPASCLLLPVLLLRLARLRAPRPKRLTKEGAGVEGGPSYGKLVTDQIISPAQIKRIYHPPVGPDETLSSWATGRTEGPPYPPRGRSERSDSVPGLPLFTERLF